jgi:intracellular sulfur oxidation DsrE/DsrF family protein
MRPPITEDYLNAFVDDELAPSERDQALAQQAEDETFKRAVCEQRMLKDLVRAAYAEPRPRAQRLAGDHRPWKQALAAALLLTLGLGAGWWARGMTAAPAVPDRLAGLPDGFHPVSLATRIDQDKIILHLDSGDPARLTGGLEIAERLLRHRDARARVEIIVNSYGLDLLRKESSHRTTIETLARDHGNLTFVACGQTIARLKRDGVNVELLPEAAIASSAISEITDRMAQGWVYVKL